MTHDFQTQVLRFHLSDRIFHAFHALIWFALMATAMCATSLRHAGNMSDFDAVIRWHLLLGIAYLGIFVTYVVMAPDRMARIVVELFRTDRNCFAWFRNFGNYPKKYFDIQIGPKEDVPQGRYNGGQRVTYAFFVFCALALILSGIALMLLHGGNKELFEAITQIHGAIALLATVCVVVAHIPMAVLSPQMRKAIAPWGDGRLPLAVAREHSELWVMNDLIVCNIDTSLLEEQKIVGKTHTCS